jgi:hypothetical protein
MLRLLLLFLIQSSAVQAMEILRDRHAGEEYVFEAIQSEITATVDAAGATAIATDWATHFYGDLLGIESCEFRNKPIRFWLISLLDPAATKKSTPSYYQTEQSSSHTH